MLQRDSPGAELKDYTTGSLDSARDDLIGLTQHRIVERAFAIAGFVVVPVIDFQIALQFQMAAACGSPFAEQMRAIAIENEMIGSGGVLHGNVDELLRRSKRDFCRLECERVFLRVDR